MAIPVGTSATVEHAVTDADLASSVGSGDVAVLGTPVLLAWCEEATLRAVSALLDPASTTVGTRVSLEHLRATPPGATVVARAEVTAATDRALTFAVTAEHRRAGADVAEVIARGEVQRAVVDRDRFVQRSSS